MQTRNLTGAHFCGASGPAAVIHRYHCKGTNIMRGGICQYVQPFSIHHLKHLLAETVLKLNFLMIAYLSIFH